MKNKKLIIIIVAAVVVIGVLCGVLIPLFSKKNKEEDTEKKSDSKKESTVVSGLPKEKGSENMEFIEYKDGKSYIIDYNGNLKTVDNIVSTGYRNGVAISVDDDKKYALIDISGKEIVPRGKYTCMMFKAVQGKELIEVYDENDKVGIIDYSGKVVIPIQYKFIKFQNITEEIAVYQCTYEDKSFDVYCGNGIKIGSYPKYTYIKVKSETDSFTDDAYFDFIEMSDGEYQIMNVNTGDKIDLDKDAQPNRMEKNAVIYNKKIEFYDKNMKVIKTFTIEELNNMFNEKFDSLEGCKLHMSTLSPSVFYFVIEGMFDHYETIVMNNKSEVIGKYNNYLNWVQNYSSKYYALSEGDNHVIYDLKGKEKLKAKNMQAVFDFGVLVKDDDMEHMRIIDFKGKDLFVNVEKKGSSTYSLENGKMLYYFNDRADYYLIDSKYDELHGAKGNNVFLQDKSKNTIAIYNLESKKITFEFKKERYKGHCDYVKAFELDDGYYNYNGKMIYEKNKSAK